MMDRNPAFWRHVCRAKLAELAGDTASAVQHLTVAARLTATADELLQVEAWKKRLEEDGQCQQRVLLATELPPEPKRTTRKARRS